MRRTAALALFAGLLAAGCGGARAPAAQLFGIADVYYAHGDFEGGALVRLDATTLRRVGRGLRLGDAVTSQALSPDGHTLVFGGVNYGELLFVDLARPARVARLNVVPPTPDGTEIDPVAWPARGRLVAVATREGSWWAPHPSRLLIVDPLRRRVVRTAALHGSVWSWVRVGGTSALLVTSGRVPRLVVVPPSGATWSRTLAPLDLAGRDGVRVAGTRYAARRVPSLASDGSSRVFVVVPDRPIAEVRLGTREVRYHHVRLPHRYLALTEPMTPGSGGIHLTYSAAATWLGGGRLAVGGADELPSLIRGEGVGHRDAQRALQILDTQTWRVARTLRATGCRRIQHVFICDASPAAGLVAYDAAWRVLYEKRSVWWDVQAGRLFAGSAMGTNIAELDPATGRVLRHVRPSPLHDQLWPLELFTWRLRGR